MKETFTVISAHGEQMIRYLKNILGKGGCNTFPEYLGTCECGVEVRSNCEELSCPSCGKQVVLSTEESFGRWSLNHPTR